MGWPPHEKGKSLKKLALVALAGMALAGASAGAALADHVTTGIGYLHSGDGYIVVAEGDAGNPGPLAGYIGIKEDLSCHGAQSGDHNSPDGDDTCSAP